MANRKYAFSIKILKDRSILNETEFKQRYVDIMSLLMLKHGLIIHYMYIEKDTQLQVPHLHGVIAIPADVRYWDLNKTVNRSVFNLELKKLTDPLYWYLYASKSGIKWDFHKERESLKNWQEYQEDLIEINREEYTPYMKTRSNDARKRLRDAVGFNG